MDCRAHLHRLQPHPVGHLLAVVVAVGGGLEAAVFGRGVVLGDGWDDLVDAAGLLGGARLRAVVSEGVVDEGGLLMGLEGGVHEYCGALLRLHRLPLVLLLELTHNVLGADDVGFEARYFVGVAVGVLVLLQPVIALVDVVLVGLIL